VTIFSRSHAPELHIWLVCRHVNLQIQHIYYIHSFIHCRIHIALLQGDCSEELPTPAWPNKSTLSLEREWTEGQRKDIPNWGVSCCEGVLLHGGGASKKEHWEGLIQLNGGRDQELRALSISIEYLYMYIKYLYI